MNNGICIGRISTTQLDKTSPKRILPSSFNLPPPEYTSTIERSLSSALRLLVEMVLPAVLQNRVSQFANDGKVRFNCHPECHEKSRSKRDKGWRAPLFFEHLIWAHYKELPFNRSCAGCPAKFFGTVDAVNHACLSKHEIVSISLDNLKKEYNESNNRSTLISYWEKPYFSFVEKTSLQVIQTMIDEGYLQLGRLCQPEQRITEHAQSTTSRMFEQNDRDAIKEIDYGEQVRKSGMEQKQVRNLAHALTKNGLNRSKSHGSYVGVRAPPWNRSSIDVQMNENDGYSPRTPLFDEVEASPCYEPRNNFRQVSPSPSLHKREGRFQQRSNESLHVQKASFRKDDYHGGGDYRGHPRTNTRRSSPSSHHQTSAERISMSDTFHSRNKRYGAPMEMPHSTKRVTYGDIRSNDVDRRESEHFDGNTYQHGSGKSGPVGQKETDCNDERKRKTRSYSRSDSD